MAKIVSKPISFAMYLAIVCLIAESQSGQAQEQRFPDRNSGIVQPPSVPQPHAEPGIFRPVARPAGVQPNVSSGVSQATWTSPVSQPTTNLSANAKASDERAIPFQPPSPTVNTSNLKKPGSSWSSTISMIVSLVIVLAIFMGVAWCIRRIAPQPSRTLSKDVVQVLGRTPLAPRHNMILIRFGRKLVLVSQQLGQTQTLSEIEDPREVDHLLGLCEEANTTSISSSFRDVLFQLANGKGSDRPSPPAKNVSFAREG